MKITCENSGTSTVHYPLKKVGMFVEFRLNDGNTMIDAFEFTLVRLKQTVDFIDTQRSILNNKREYLRIQINEMIANGNVGTELLRTAIINYLATFQSPRKVLKENPNQSVGFIMYINTNDTVDSMIGGMDFTTFERLAERVLV